MNLSYPLKATKLRSCPQYFFMKYGGIEQPLEALLNYRQITRGQFLSLIQIFF